MDNKNTVELKMRRSTKEPASSSECKKEASSNLSECNNGVCSISWKPVKPAA